MRILFYMRAGEVSKTAQYMAFFRALESQNESRQRLFDDPYAFALLPTALRRFVRLARIPIFGRLVHWILEWGWPYTRSSAVVRTRAIDDMVREGLLRGARQLVLLGAGFDSRGLRLEEAQRVSVFEVDHPDTQRAKKERLAAYLGLLPNNIHYVAVDFEKDNVATELIKAGFDHSTPSVVLWEGVLSYLTESAVRGTFDFLNRLLASSSLLILTYMDKGALDGSLTFPGARRWKSWVRFSGEPFVCCLDPNTLADTLRPFGFLLKTDKSTKQIAEYYCPSLGRREPGSMAYRVASAERAEVEFCQR